MWTSVKTKMSQTPWLDSCGRPVTLSALQEISRNWSTEIWEAYLGSLEASQSEYLSGHAPSLDAPISPGADLVEEKDAEVSGPGMKVAMAELPSLDQAVIESLLVDRISERSAAALYGVTRWRIRVLKERAMKNLKDKIG